MIQPRHIEISVVVPAFNEQETIVKSLETIVEVLESFCPDYEVIVVDDGSTDSTAKLIHEFRLNKPKIEFLKLLSNYGHMAAIEQGMLHASGEYIVTIDADLQDDPKDIERMYEIILANNESGSSKIDVVQAFRRDRTSDSYFKRVSALIYYRGIRKLTGIPIVQDSADFRMITKEVNRLVHSLPERNKIYRLLIPALGFRIEYLPTTRHQRFAGRSKYTFSKMFGLAVGSLTEFSDKPLKMMVKFGFATSLMMSLFGLISFILWLRGATVPGWTSIVFLVLASNSLIMMSLGFLGIYIGNIYSHLKGRPISIVESSTKPASMFKPIF